MRASFLQNWHKHWGHVQEMAPFADIHGLIGFIKNADTTRFWQHAGLQEWHIPYIFLATCEFPPKAHRTEWLRFMFDGKVRDFQDLWIRTTGTWRFLKMRYRNPRTGFPGPAQYIDCDLVPPDAGFLTRAFKSPHSYPQGAMFQAYGV